MAYENQIKCAGCGISIPFVAEDADPEALLCDRCHTAGRPLVPLTIYELEACTTPTPYKYDAGLAMIVAPAAPRLCEDVPLTVANVQSACQGENPQADMMMMVHCRNKFMLALAELKRLAANQEGISEEYLTDIARVDLTLIAELEDVRA